MQIEAIVVTVATKFATKLELSRRWTQLSAATPQHCYCFLPEPQGHISFRPTLVTVRQFTSSPD